MMAPRRGEWQPAAVLFDLDDTLCDYATARAVRLRRAFSLAAQHDGAAVDVDFDRLIEESIAIHPHGADHFGMLLARHGIANPEAARRATEWYRENRFHGLQLFPESVDVLTEVRRIVMSATGASLRPIGIVTNGPAEVQRAKLDLLAVERLVDFAVVSGELGIEKPDRAIFVEALRLSGATPETTLMVGDSLEFDIAGAHAAGIDSVWLNRKGGAVPDGVRGATHELGSLDELPALLSRLAHG